MGRWASRAREKPTTAKEPGHVAADEGHLHECGRQHRWNHAGATAATCALPRVLGPDDCPLCSGRDDLLIRGQHSHYCPTCDGEWTHAGKCPDAWAADCPWDFPRRGTVVASGATRLGSHVHYCPECSRSWTHEVACLSALRVVLPECTGCAAPPARGRSQSLVGLAAAALIVIVGGATITWGIRSWSGWVRESRLRTSPAAPHSVASPVETHERGSETLAAIPPPPVAALEPDTSVRREEPAGPTAPAAVQADASSSQPPAGRETPPAVKKADARDVSRPPRRLAFNPPAPTLAPPPAKPVPPSPSPAPPIPRPPNAPTPREPSRPAAPNVAAAPRPQDPAPAVTDEVRRSAPGAHQFFNPQGTPGPSGPIARGPTWLETPPPDQRASVAPPTAIATSPKLELVATASWPAVVRLVPISAGARWDPHGPREVLGFIVDPAGYIVTTDQFGDDIRGIEVALVDGRRLRVTRAARDSLAGFSILKVEGERLPGERLPSIVLGESRGLVTGGTLIVIQGRGASPAAAVLTIRSTGSATGGNLVTDQLLALPGDLAGAPLLNLRGEVVGVRVGSVSGRIGQAVPIDRVKPLLRQFVATDLSLRSTPGAWWR